MHNNFASSCDMKLINSNIQFLVCCISQFFLHCYSSVAGVTEIPMQDSFVGELFGNILGDGFSRLVKGDRFYFESSESGLTPGEFVVAYTLYH